VFVIFIHIFHDKSYLLIEFYNFTGSTMMNDTTILSQSQAKQLQLRNKLRLGKWNIHSMLQLGKVQLLGEDMM